MVKVIKTIQIPDLIYIKKGKQENGRFKQK